MTIKLEKRLVSLAKKLNKPLYAVGGVVRNFLIDKSIARDIDLSASVAVEELLPILKEVGFTVVAEYKRTGTVVFKSSKQKYEYTAFRKEVYAKGGAHTPVEVYPTDDILEDARRRDFKCNAVYYDIAKGEIVDVLGGVEDIKNKILDTVIEPERVFENDGLRLLRLARFAGELNFKPTDRVLFAMEMYADNISAISPERVFSELKKILVSDKAYPFSDVKGHYTGLKILDKTMVLDRIFPELTMGRSMAQRADFHKYDVLEHSLRCVLYSPPRVRLASLFHDIGKPYCFKRDGKYYYHDIEGVKIAGEVLKRLKADNRTISQVKYLIKEHMVDLDCSMEENEVRLFLVDNYDKLDELAEVKQADFRASLERDEPAPTIVKWQKILHNMLSDGVPFTVRGLAISAKELLEMGVDERKIGQTQKKLLELTATKRLRNDKETLASLVKKQI